MRKILPLLLLMSFCLTLSAQRFVTQTEAKTAAVHYMAPKFGDQQYSQDNILAVHELKQKGHTLIYEVLFKNNTSVLLSGVKSCKAIVGYRFKTGGISVLNQSKDVVSPGMNIFLEKCCVQILYAIEEMENKNWVSGEWKELLKPESNKSKQKFQSGVYGPYITSAWGQTKAFPKVCDGYNYYVKETVQQCACANIKKCPTGCVATAMGQIMRYWQYPTTSPYTGEYYDWSNMPDTLKAKSPKFEQERKAIARLLRDCGESAEMQYCYAPKRYGCQSFAWPAKARDGFVDKFNYSGSADRKLRSSFSTKSWKGMLIDNIKRGFPVLYASASLGVKDFAECGHAYVCDGYNENTDMFHFNWGYDGEANGWYSLDNLVINFSKQSYNWNHLERMVINLYPAYLDEVKEVIFGNKVAEN
ncbi:MAG: C10 family peptidase [Bacteroidales bacterium]|nr:C10 family peptidase [Bacteroidales bacterium]